MDPTSQAASEPIGVFLIVDDDLLSARGLTRLLRPFGAFHHAASLLEAREMARQFDHWTGWLIDIALTDGSGLALVEEARAAQLSLPIAVISGTSEPSAINRTHKLNATYLCKNGDGFADEVKQFAHRAVSERIARSKRLAMILAREARSAQLSSSEALLLTRLVTGDRKQVSALHGRSQNTIKTQIAAILRKTGAVSIDVIRRRTFNEALEVAGPDPETPGRAPK